MVSWGVVCALVAFCLCVKCGRSASWQPSDPEIPLNLPQLNRTCQQISLKNFPSDFFTNERRLQGWIAVHIAAALYAFGALVLLIQAYLAAALKTFCDRFHIASDPARNTVDVIGTSLPVFWCNLVSGFFGTGAMGAGTVIGTCGVNSLFTLGLVGLLLGTPVKLSWYPLWRDNIFYFMAVTILLWISHDHIVLWQESLFVVSFYFIYLLFINLNQKLERGVRRIVLMYRGDDEKEIEVRQTEDEKKEAARHSSRQQLHREAILEEQSFELSEEQPLLKDTYELEQSSGQANKTDQEEARPLWMEDGYQSTGGGYTSEEPPTPGYFSDANAPGPSEADAPGRSNRGYGSTRTSVYASHVSHLHRHTKRFKVQGSYFLTLELDHYVHGPRSPFAAPSHWYWYPLWVLAMPAIMVFSVTVPDCRRPNLRKWYWCTLLLSTLWVAILSYLLVWMSFVIGFTLRIPSSMMGFIFLSFGLSISQMVVTYLASRAGQGNKVVYSVLGSNVFNISICLGLVWLFKSIIHNPNVLPGNSFLYVNLCQLVIVLTPLLLQFTRWRLKKVLAVVFVCLYALFIALIVMFEYNIIADLNPEVC